MVLPTPFYPNGIGEAAVLLKFQWSEGQGLFGLCYSVLSQKMSTQLQTPLHRRSFRPRNNLPRTVSRKRGESNYVLAFARVYRDAFPTNTTVIAKREVAVSGFGIPDLLWLSAEKTTTELFAFEMKLTDWRKALAQAYRYRYFANSVYVVLPPEHAQRAMQFIQLFQHTDVGLLAFDKERREINNIYTPQRPVPLNMKAHALASALMTPPSKKLGNSPEQPEAFTQWFDVA